MPPEVSPTARYLLVGEAPDEMEATIGVPFCGASGKLLEGFLGTVGLARRDFNITNVVPWRPPGNNIDKWFVKGGEPNELVTEGVRRLHEFIHDTRPAGILAVGNTALWALTGHRGITDRRGSIYWYQLGVRDAECFERIDVAADVCGGGAAPTILGRPTTRIPVLATIHPVAVLREPTSANLVARDFHRFMLLVGGHLPHGGHEPERRLVLFPTHDDLEASIDECYNADMLAVDIETGGGKLQCVGFSPRAEYSICIPVDMEERRNVIDLFLRAACPKVFHHAPYDYPYLIQKCGYKINGEIHDTLAMAQAIHPELPRDLGTLTSLYTLQPYYKDVGKLWKVNADVAAYWRYNALDAACTREIAGVLEEKLKKNDLWSVYERTRRVLPHAMGMSIRGVKYDAQRAGILATKALTTSARYQKILDARAGRPINVNSNPQVTKLLYEDFKLPQRKKHGSTGLAADQKSILSLYPHVTDRRIRQAIRAILRIRHARKFESSYLSVPPSADGRMRSSFNPAGTETGRWSASKYLITEGVNLQTVTARWKDCFVADDDRLLWNADYSQIEARLVSYLARDKRSIGIFESGGDIHRENAAVIFQKAPDQISAREREIGKTVHALNYGVGVDTLMETVNKRALDTGVWISRSLAQHVRTTYLNNFDRVVRWQEETWEEVQKSHALTNPFGRRRIFLGPVRGTGSEHTRKEALAFVPQSTVPDLLNEALIDLREHPPVQDFEVFLNIHDALFGQGPMTGTTGSTTFTHSNSLSEILWLAPILKAMQRSIPISPDCSIIVPVDLQVGTRWGTMYKLPRVSS